MSESDNEYMRTYRAQRKDQKRIVRCEVQVHEDDAPLIKSMAKELRKQRKNNESQD